MMPEAEPSAMANLSAELRRLHTEAGRPSHRKVASEIGISHTAIAQALRGIYLTRWPNLEKITEALHGDVPTVRALWVRAAEQYGRHSSAFIGVHEFRCPHCGANSKVRLVAVDTSPGEKGNRDDA